MNIVNIRFRHAPLLSRIAYKESVVNDMRTELEIHEKELRKLRIEWKKITNACNDNDQNSHRRSSSSIQSISSLKGKLTDTLNQNNDQNNENDNDNEDNNSTPVETRANAFLQRGVEMLVEGVEAFWDGFRNGPR